LALLLCFRLQLPAAIYYDLQSTRQSEKTLSGIVKECNTFQNWKLSGDHEDSGNSDDARIPFSNSVQNDDSLHLHLHEIVYQCQDVFSKVTAELPKEAFTESRRMWIFRLMKDVDLSIDDSWFLVHVRYRCVEDDDVVP